MTEIDLSRAEALAREVHAVATGRGGPHGICEIAQRLADEVIHLAQPEPDLPAFPMPAAGEVEEGDEVTCPHRDEETGEVCGAVMEVQERVWDYRPVHWGEGRDGSVVVNIGCGQLGDGEFVSFECEHGHAFAPD